jgi:hypothetical protein
MTLDLMKERGVPLDQQTFTWRDLVQPPYSKLNDDAFTRIRVILMNGIERHQQRVLHHIMLRDRDLRPHLARIRRLEHHQQTLVNWLNPGDQSPLETTIGYEQTAIEVTASLAQNEPDPYLAQVYRFGLLEDFDHLYRYSALMDRLEGKDANNILQSYTDIRPGRPTLVQHRHPEDDLREPYSRQADPRSKMNAITLYAGEFQTHDYYMNIGPLFSDPVARQLYAEIASIEEQHIAQYGSLLNPDETVLERWLLHEANEVWNYWSCAESETNAQIKSIWQRFCEYELGHLQYVIELFKRIERRDPAEVLPQTLPKPIEYASHREYVRQVLAKEVEYTAVGPQIGPFQDTPRTLAYREQLNSQGSPTELVAAGYQWSPGTELVKKLEQRRSAREARP